MTVKTELERLKKDKEELEKDKQILEKALDGLLSQETTLYGKGVELSKRKSTLAQTLQAKTKRNWRRIWTSQQ